MGVGPEGHGLDVLVEEDGVAAAAGEAPVGVVGAFLLDIAIGSVNNFDIFGGGVVVGGEGVVEIFRLVGGGAGKEHVRIDIGIIAVLFFYVP